MTLVPRPYQIEGRDFLAARRFALLADEMRVGKTPQAILAAREIGAATVLVVCPAIAVEHWKKELDKWGAKYRSGWCVVSYDYLRRNSHDFLSRHWDLVIVDECHFAKNPEAQRTKLIYGKGGLGWVADRLWALSGTPAPKHAAELWPLLRAFGVVKMTYDEFVHRYCTVNSFTLQITGTKEAMIPELRALLATVMLRRTRAQVAPDMPKIDYQFLEVQPDRQVDLTAPTGQTDEQLVDYLESHPAADKEVRQEVAMAKVPALVEQIEFAIHNGLLKQCVVFGWHTAPLKELVGQLHERHITAASITGQTSPKEREQIQQQFLEGGLQVIAGNILACGTAIDLSAARHGYFLELDWVSGNNQQAANRLVNMDKLDKVTMDVVTWPGSVDDRVQQVLIRRVKELSQLY